MTDKFIIDSILSKGELTVGVCLANQKIENIIYYIGVSLRSDKRNFFGTKILHGANQLFYSLFPHVQDGEIITRERMERNRIQHDNKKYWLEFQHTIYGDYERDINALEVYLRENTEVTVVLIDSWDDFSLGISAKGSKEEFEAMQKLRDIAQNFDVAIYLLKHVRSLKNSEYSEYDICETREFRLPFDKLWIMQQKPDSNIFTVSVYDYTRKIEVLEIGTSNNYRWEGCKIEE